MLFFVLFLCFYLFGVGVVLVTDADIFLRGGEWEWVSFVSCWVYLRGWDEMRWDEMR